MSNVMLPNASNERGLTAHIDQLDGLRGVAITLVIFTHAAQGWRAAASIFPNTDRVLLSPDLQNWLASIASGASHGVQLFFVVSAFTLVLRWSGAGYTLLQSYFLRRLLRIGPAYWLAAIFYLCVGGVSAARAFAPNGVSLSDVMIALLFGSAWQGGAAMAVVPGGWSVSCEATFYLLLPIILYVINNKVHRAAFFAISITVVVSFICRQQMLNGDWNFQSYAHPLSQAPVFAVGIFAALLYKNFKLAPIKFASVSIVIFSTIVWPFSPIKDHHIPTHITYAWIASLATLMVSIDQKSIFGTRFLRNLGEKSYSMYLVHFALLWPSAKFTSFFLEKYDYFFMLFHFIFTLILSYCISILTYRFIERPFVEFARSVSKR